MEAGSESGLKNAKTKSSVGDVSPAAALKIARMRERRKQRKIGRIKFLKLKKAGERATAGEEAQEEEEITAQQPIKKKKKKSKKKKKKFEKNGAPEASKEEVIKVEEPGKDVKKEKKDDKKKQKDEEALERLNSGRFRFLNEQLYTVKSEEAWELFQKDPEAFRVYHQGFAQQTQKWPNKPLGVIIRWLQAKPSGQIVLDLGCGEAKIASVVGQKHDVRSYDLVAVNARVTACDMAHLPLEDECANIAVFCLSLMGTNLADFLREARRVLKPGGTLKIAEVTSRFSNPRHFCDAVCKLGFELTHKASLTDYFTMLEFTKAGKVLNKRPYGLLLKPCLYKKR